MAVKDADETELIEAVCTRIRERLPDDQAGPCQEFVRQYYRWVPAADLADRGPIDLYGAAIAHWNLAQHRRPGETKVHVYNPDFEQNGWQSPHTVIEVVSDDIPFLVDSVTMELSRQGYSPHLLSHPVLRVVRDADGMLLTVIPPDVDVDEATSESVIHVELDREPDHQRLLMLKEAIERVLGDVRASVADWHPMRDRALELADGLADPEASAFLNWLAAKNFTFLGYREYELEHGDEGARLVAIADSGLGILRGTPRTVVTPLSDRALELALDRSPLVLTKANSRATVHRPAYLDYVGVKRFDAGGDVIGERRFLGLYTTDAYRERALEIPVIRGKVDHVLADAGFPSDSHDAKALIEICETYPRDSLFQITAEELSRIALGILTLGERQRVRVFARRDPLDRFVDCLVCMPRDRFNTQNREAAARILMVALGGPHYDWTLQLSESTLARIQIVVRTPDGIRDGWDEPELERQLVAAIRAWSDDLREALIEEYGEQLGLERFRTYEYAFPPAYRDDWSPRTAVSDIARIEELATRQQPILRLYRLLEAEPGMLRCKLFSNTAVSLSAVLPTFEHMGARVIDERPYELRTAQRSAWIYEFGMECVADDIEESHELFEDVFLGVWRGELEDDWLGGLVLPARLNGRQITVVRAIGKYLRQAGIPFSDRYMERTLVAHPEIVGLLVELFELRHDPTLERQGLAGLGGPAANGSGPAGDVEVLLERAIDSVQSLDQDRILRAYLSVVRAILRTNYYQPGVAGGGFDGFKPYLSFKLDPSVVPVLPRPLPKFEIFVYSPRVEGVHLRGGSVARGGLRWSDRPEDFRTEILGLMKAQMVKNALIVPVGSKGGFVVKQPPPPEAGREAMTAEGIDCYKTFLSGLLDLTDNIVDGQVVPPAELVRYDGDDPYLVVAADKGTASFSDIANSVSADYGFWLGDAFASGGSQGYDHKAMGITARGAWESVKRHFRELGIDVQSTEFTVVGIGDMAGDVFGNGMLLSEQIRLVAAFNHIHVFLDPDPDAASSFAERQRLFELPRSAWSDYDAELISPGGGVYSRALKQIPISEQVRAALGIAEEVTQLAPAELISCILRAPVDLLWNGGIGTYVKATSESQADVGDKANDALRVNGVDLRCRVVGEGGNLGLTQLGRIEYARGGGRINTDAIDNVAGVNTSDHEVNIKILVDAAVSAGELTVKQRNELLHETTDGVSERVLYGSYTQTQALSLSLQQAPEMVGVHARLIRLLEHEAGLVRELEFLPTDRELLERRRAGTGLTSPELSVVMAYCKVHLKQRLLDSDLPEDPFLAHDLERYFPAPLPQRYGEEMRSHRLRREIIATIVANQLVDRTGTTSAFRLREETGAPPQLLARAYSVSREVFGMRSVWAQVESLDNRIEAPVQRSMLIESRKLIERATRWLVRGYTSAIDVQALVERYSDAAELLREAIPEVLDEDSRVAFDERAAALTAAGVTESLARHVAGMPALLPTFDIVEVASNTGRDIETVMHASFQISAALQLGWLRERILELPRGDRWQALARAALRDDLSNLVQALTTEVLEAGAAAGVDGGSDDFGPAAIEAWRQQRGHAVDRCHGMLSDIRASGTFDTTTLPVALREVRNLLGAAG
jgi:glutamate dehydrogenase